MSDGADLLEIEEEITRRVAAVNSFYMTSQHITDVLGMIHALRLRGFRSDGSAMCMQLSGPTGSGKSLLFDRYIARPDAQATDDHVPVLRAKMPSKYSEANFVGALLDSYGAQSFQGRQDLAQLERRLRKLIELKRTELIMIDDLQHVIDQKERMAKVPYYAADQFKNLLLDGARVPVVFNGLTISDQIYERNTQLKLRRLYKEALKPFDWRDPLEREQFTIFVGLIARRAGFENYANLDDGLVERIWRACEGIRGQVSSLLKRTVEPAVRRQVPNLTLELLAQAHAQGADVGPNWKNVFTLAVLPRLGEENTPDQSRVTKLKKGIARIGASKGDL